MIKPLTTPLACIYHHITKAKRLSRCSSPNNIQLHKCNGAYSVSDVKSAKKQIYLTDRIFALYSAGSGSE